VNRYQKGKINLDFTETRDSEWQWHQLGYIQVCTSLQTDNHTSNPPLKFFYRPDALPAAQPTVESTNKCPKFSLVQFLGFRFTYARVRLQSVHQQMDDLLYMSHNIIIIITTMTMFMVLSSRPSHCESSVSSSDECRLSTGWPPIPLTWTVSPPKIGRYYPYP